MKCFFRWFAFLTGMALSSVVLAQSFAMNRTQLWDAWTDDDISMLPLQGGLSIALSGLGVFSPHGCPTWSTSSQLNIGFERTVAGIGRGADEILRAILSDPYVATHSGGRGVP